MTQEVSRTDTGCCPPFDPTPWQETEVTWHDKLFLRDHVDCVLHVPLNMKRTVARDLERIHVAHAETADRPLMLGHDTSAWGTDLFIEVTRPVPGAAMEGLSGTFLTKVFEGPFGQAGSWVREMEDYVAAKGRKLETVYFGYTTCPKCAKAYGKNSVVLFAKVTPETEH
jgi:hypothetical protein